MHIHFVGIAGSAMGSVAIACKNLGHTVTGSDVAVYEPMRTLLEQKNILWSEGYNADNVLSTVPDVTVIGNAISRGNPELEAALDNRLPITSMAALVGAELIGNSTSIVITGTHGKTTTSSLTAWLLEYADCNPGFLIGGVPRNFTTGCRPPTNNRYNNPVFVSEGDEYDTAFFDKRSKFVHYRPTVVVVNNIEFDHADIFNSLEDILKSFSQLIRIVPKNGLLLFNADDEHAMSLTQHATTPVQTIGFSERSTWQICNHYSDALGAHFDVVFNSKPYGTFFVPMPGEHSMRNAVCAIAATAFYGLDAHVQREALAAFLPPKRRLEKIGIWHGAIVVDDFAHHPTAIKATIQALRAQYPVSNIHAVFEPRSNTTTRAFFQHELATCFDGVTSVTIGPVNRPERYKESDRLNTPQLQADITARGIHAWCLESSLAQDNSWGKFVEQHLRTLVQENDIIVILSNGNVGGLRATLQSSLPSQ